MMRVFRPTSPMNMGVWILSAAAPAAIATVLLANRRGFPGAIGDAAGYLSGVFGAALAGYTGVLVANSAIPLWQDSRRWLPVMFIASSAASAASTIDLISAAPRSRAVTRVFGSAAKVAEIAAAKMVEQTASATPKVGEPLHRGGSAVLWRAAAGLTAASLVLAFKWPRAAGVLGTAGSLCLRFAVHYATNASAGDPSASFHQQRR
jgi:hypothetical protein